MKSWMGRKNIFIEEFFQLFILKLHFLSTVFTYRDVLPHFRNLRNMTFKWFTDKSSKSLHADKISSRKKIELKYIFIKWLSQLSTLKLQYLWTVLTYRHFSPHFGNLTNRQIIYIILEVIKVFRRCMKKPKNKMWGF